MFDRFTDNSRRLVQHARAAAARHHNPAIGPEHLLLALLELPDCNAHRLLRDLDVEPEPLRQAFEDVLLPSNTSSASGVEQLPFTPQCKQVLERTIEAAAALSQSHIGTEHVLLGILSVPGTGAVEVLQRLGLTHQAAFDRVCAIHSQETDRRRLLLISNSTMHGGSYLAHCRDQLVEFLGPQRRTVTFVPYALHDHAAYTQKAREAFAALGHELVSIHERKNDARAFADAEAVFVGGGNTFRLLSTLQHHGMIDAIRVRVQGGMPYVGSSAGTNVATLSIRTTNDMPIVQPQTFQALALVPFQINPHYLDPDPASKHMGETREERIRQFHEEHAVPVLGLREGCMLRVEGPRMTLLGSTAARLFRRDMEPKEFAPPCDLSFLLQEA